MRWFLLVLSFSLQAYSAEKIEIVRDEYGIPHIFAQTAAGAAYGSGYAQASDRAEQLLQNLKSAHGGEVSLTAPVRSMVEAYCAGANAWFAENHRGERVEPAMVEAFSRSAFGSIRESSDVLIAPSRSTDKAVISILSPLGSWYGSARLYAIHMSAADSGLEFSGVGPVGVPFPLLGHSAFVSVSGRGAGEGGANALDQAWAMIAAKNLEEEKRALAMGQLPAQKFLIGTAEGDIFDSSTGVTNPPEGVLLSGGGVPQAVAMQRQLLTDAYTFSLESAASLAFATDVYKAEEWQKRIAKVAPGSDFVRMLTGWSRRAEATSREALAFYLFKMALDDDARTLEPPDTVSDGRIRAALRKAQDRFETEFNFDATYGTLFRIGRDGAQRSWPLGGGTVTGVGMATPRAVDYEARDRRMVARGGQAALQVAVLAKPTRSVIAMPLGESDQAGSAHFDDEARDLYSVSHTFATYFADRKTLEKTSKNKKELIF
ncbi:MAG TPA: penicillin acylase family protein [Bryobacteraceae bacterium]